MSDDRELFEAWARTKFPLAYKNDLPGNPLTGYAKGAVANAWEGFQAARRAEGADKLHDAIMNIPCDASRANTVLLSAPMAYAIGHRDARHAAAELALSVIPEQPVPSHLAVSPAVSPQAGSQIAGRAAGRIADQHRKQEERRCYVCGGRDGGCHGINGEMYECPWY